MKKNKPAFLLPIAAGSVIFSAFLVSAAYPQNTPKAPSTASPSDPPPIAETGKGGAIQLTHTPPPPATVKDVAYADKSAAQKLDIYLPQKGTAPYPLVIYIHGGAFKVGDKEHPEGEFAPVLNAGYAIASLNYRLSGEAIFPAQVQDVKAAVRWLRANAKTYNIDPERFAVWGASAGGNLAAMVGTTGDTTIFDDASLGNPGISSRVNAVIDFFGPIDFATMDEQFAQAGNCANPEIHNVATSPESILMGGPIQSKLDVVKAANPMTYISKDDPPFLIQHGSADCVVPCAQSQVFAEALETVLGKDDVILTIHQGDGHDGPQFHSAENMVKVVAFLDKSVKEPLINAVR